MKKLIETAIESPARRSARPQATSMAGGPGRSGYPTSGGFLQAAGGVGGLLAVYDAGEADSYVYFHDANGNVGQVVACESGYGSAAKAL